MKKQLSLNEWIWARDVRSIKWIQVVTKVCLHDVPTSWCHHVHKRPDRFLCTAHLCSRHRCWSLKQAQNSLVSFTGQISPLGGAMWGLYLNEWTFTEPTTTLLGHIFPQHIEWCRWWTQMTVGHWLYTDRDREWCDSFSQLITFFWITSRVCESS